VLVDLGFCGLQASTPAILFGDGVKPYVLTHAVDRTAGDGARGLGRGNERVSAAGR
jgi:hypothetical protein